MMSLSPDLSGPDIRTAPLYRKPEGWPSPDKHLLTREQARVSMYKLQMIVYTKTKWEEYQTDTDTSVWSLSHT